MQWILVILLSLLGLVALFFILGIFMRKHHFVKRSIVIAAPRHNLYEFLRYLENQEKFNKWAKEDSDRIKEFRGTDGTVGFVYSWKGNKKVGEGEKEILALEEGKKIETEIRFIKPMTVTARMSMELESVPDQQTRVSLSNSGTLRYPLNVLIPMMEKNFGKDLEESLEKLKSIFEKQAG